MDRGYIDFERLYRLHAAGSFFVTRAKSNLKAQRRYSRPVDRSTGLICDQTIVLTGFYSRQDFDTPVRRIKFKDPQTGKRLVFLTNNFALPAITIAELYRCRWQVELFFKWIKQHLRIKVFFGTSENAVKSQIWIAVSVYVLVAIVKKRLNLSASLYEILQILSLTMFERVLLSLYVVLDLYSRCVVAWMVAGRENSALAKQLLAEAITRHGIEPGGLRVHQDRGAPMTAHGFLDLLAQLGVDPSHSRPRVSNDNAFSEAQFKTLKYLKTYKDGVFVRGNSCNVVIEGNQLDNAWRRPFG